MGIRKEVKVLADIPLIRQTIEMLTSCGQQQHGADYISHNPRRGLKGDYSIKNTHAIRHLSDVYDIPYRKYLGNY